MKLQQPAPFLDWLRTNLARYVVPGSQLARDEEMQRAFAATLGLPLWNAMPLPRRGFRTEPIPETGHPDSAIELLEPMLGEPLQHEDDLAAHALDLLCNAYDARRARHSAQPPISALPAS